MLDFILYTNISRDKKVVIFLFKYFSSFYKRC